MIEFPPHLFVETLARIRPHVRRTPVLDADRAEFGLPAGPLQFKIEQLQHTGSFKVRGAFNNLLSRPVPPAGVVAASGGNHGAAVAFAARATGVRAAIFVPAISAASKIDRIRAYGAELVVGGDSYADALAAAEAHERRTGALPIHAFDAPETVGGQGTVAAEWAEQSLPDSVLVAVGGGGLLAGVAAAFGGRVKVIAVESDGAPTLQRALAAGVPVDAPVGGIAADSLAPRRIGRLAFAVAQELVTPPVVLVTDDEIRAAQAALWRGLRLVAEPGGAAAFAALLSGRYRPEPGERVGVLLCGANTDPGAVG